jgi:OOP family OmpA-OmpF porin
MTKNAIIGVGLLALTILAAVCLWNHAGSILASRAGTPPFLDLAADSGRIVVHALVPEEAARTRLLSRVRELFAAGQVVDDVRVGDKVGKVAWLEEALRIMPLVPHGVNNAAMRISGDTLTFRGEVTTGEAKNKILEEARKTALKTLVLNDQLVVVAREQQIARVQLRLNDELSGKIIEFETGSARITPNGTAILDKLFPIIQSAGDATIEIAGHTDSVGKEENNLKLSEARGRAVREYLVAKGVQPERLTPVGYGSKKPVASNATPSGRKQNRRIEFQVLKGE